MANKRTDILQAENHPHAKQKSVVIIALLGLAALTASGLCINNAMAQNKPVTVQKSLSSQSDLIADKAIKLVSQRDTNINSANKPVAKHDDDEPTPLDEMAVMAYSSQKKAKTKADSAAINAAATPHPKIGEDGYTQYINNKAVSPDGKTGTVKLSFTVKKDGTFNDFKIIQSLSDDADKLAINIIKNGPAWVAPSNGQAKPVTIQVKFHKAG